MGCGIPRATGGLADHASTRCQQDREQNLRGKKKHFERSLCLCKYVRLQEIRRDSFRNHSNNLQND